VDAQTTMAFGIRGVKCGCCGDGGGAQQSRCCIKQHGATLQSRPLAKALGSCLTRVPNNEASINIHRHFSHLEAALSEEQLPQLTILPFCLERIQLR
jgi:hypothetical protein